MKRSSPLLCFCFALIITSSLGQLSFTNPFVSNPDVQEWTITEKTYGKLLTLSTKEGFSWIIPDIMALNDKVYVTFGCVSSGSVVDFGIGTYAYESNGTPSRYAAGSVILPVIGGGFAGLAADTRSWYYPTKPILGQSVRDQYASLTDKVFIFTKSSTGTFQTGISYAISQRGSIIYSSTTPLIMGFNTLSFEVLNCGSATFCIQTEAQYQQSKGVCEPGETLTCQTPATCSTVAHQTDCSTDSSLIIDNLSCVSQCSTGIPTTIKTGISVCQCTNNCKECPNNPGTCASCLANNFLDSDSSSCSTSCPNQKYKDNTKMTCESSCKSPCQNCDEFVDKCTKCIDNYYLYNNECINACPDGYTADSASGECKAWSGSIKSIESSSSGSSTWKFTLVLGLVAMIALAGILIIIKVKGTFRGKVYLAKEIPQDSTDISTTPTPAEASPAMKEINA